MPTVGVVGASGALGKEILAVLSKVSWRPERVLAYASARTSVTHVEFGDASLPVDDVANLSLEDLDLLFLAVPPDVARPLGESAVAEGVAVIDLSGAFAGDSDVPLVVPWVNPEVLREAPARGLVAVPSAAAVLVASVLGPLWRMGLASEMHAQLLVPASSEGRDGIDELSRQVVALFNSGTPPRKVFEQGLAFDLLPAVGDVAPDGWTAREHRALGEVGRLLGVPVEGSITLTGVPVFSGISATLQLHPPGDVPLERIAQVLQQGGVQVAAGAARQLPRPRRVEGQPFVHVGRIRVGAGLHLWATMDNLRGTATVAVGAAGVLWRARGEA
jgi:aspartate-semialdehyde dehydrogenase